jgi:hypothetical protein
MPHLQLPVYVEKETRRLVPPPALIAHGGAVIHFGPVSRSNGHRSPIAALDRIAELAQTLAPLLEDAADAGTRKSHGPIGENGRGKGFTDSDPTGSVALDPTRRQMRAAVRRAAGLIMRAEDELQEAGAVIANGYLRLDHQEWIRVVEKRSAALQGRVGHSPNHSPRSG